MADPESFHPTRREAIAGAGAGFVALSAGLPAEAAEPPAGGVAGIVARPGEAVRLALTVNGERREVALDDPRVVLLDLLRDRLGLTGAKKGCGHGQCGACTVLVNGRRINSCLALALSHDGDEVTTVEGLAQGDTLHPVQAAFIAHDGFQCGFCTPGQVVSAVGLIHENRAGHDPERVREEMSGNLCRCGAYQGITEAVLDAQRTMEARR